MYCAVAESDSEYRESRWDPKLTCTSLPHALIAVPRATGTAPPPLKIPPLTVRQQDPGAPVPTKVYLYYY